MTIEFHVVGDPIPQGSMRAFVRGGKPRTVAGNQGALERWRGDIRSAVRDKAPAVPFAGPVEMTLGFRFARPKGHYLPANGRRPMPELRLDAPAFVAGQPDLDKLCRAVLDALTGIVYVDDALVVDLVAVKRYANGGGDVPGVSVAIEEVTR
jgi:crossover junction endodeoxyribonuclease RusA